MKLVLFDIDGTLIDSGGAGTRALGMAFKEVLSMESATAGISMAGKTDIQIIKEGLARLGIPASDGIVPRILDSYIGNLKAEMLRSGTGGLPPGRLIPGARELLDYLMSTAEVRVGLLTGNVREGAFIKLATFGIHRYFSFGAFGSDSEDRKKLLPYAVRMYRDISGIAVDYRDCVVIGDTPRDIECAKPHGALAVAVATGPYSAEELGKAGADAVFDGMPDGDALLGLISSP